MRERIYLEPASTVYEEKRNEEVRQLEKDYFTRYEKSINQEVIIKMLEDSDKRIQKRVDALKAENKKLRENIGFCEWKLEEMEALKKAIRGSGLFFEDYELDLLINIIKVII